MNIRYLVLAGLAWYGLAMGAGASEASRKDGYTVYLYEPGLFIDKTTISTANTIPFQHKDVQDVISLFQQGAQNYSKGDVILFAGQEYAIIHLDIANPKNMFIQAKMVNPPATFVIDDTTYAVDEMSIIIEGSIDKLSFKRCIDLVLAKGHLWNDVFYRQEVIGQDNEFHIEHFPKRFPTKWGALVGISGFALICYLKNYRA